MGSPHDGFSPGDLRSAEVITVIQPYLELGLKHSKLANGFILWRRMALRKTRGFQICPITQSSRLSTSLDKRTG